MQRVLKRIIEEALGESIPSEGLPRLNLTIGDRADKLCDSIRAELDVLIAPEELRRASSLSELSSLIEPRLPKDLSGRTLVDIYAALEQVAREELHPRIDYHWYAQWDSFFTTGNWLTAPEPYDTVEMVIRLEEMFGFKIPDHDAESLKTVGQTVRYLWSRSKGRRA